jgi:hypothetical protein
MKSLRHLDSAGETKGALLEVAAGYGHIVIKALEAGTTKIIANEIDARQLEIIKLRMPARFANQLFCSPGRFPEELDFPKASFAGIYNAGYFTFSMACRFAQALQSFIVGLSWAVACFMNDAIYRAIFKPLLPAHEHRLASGDKSPGLIENVASASPSMCPGGISQDDELSRPNCASAGIDAVGFRVLTAGFRAHTGTFAPGRLDGRELTSAIGIKE